MSLISTEGLIHKQGPAAVQLHAALQKYRAALDASDMGVGKTYTCGAVLRALNVPSLVVCTKSGMFGWGRMGKVLGVEFDVLNYEMVRTGRTPYGTWGYHALDPKHIGPEIFRWHKEIGCLVFDEAHRCTSQEDTLQAKMMIAARRQRIPTIALSATIADNPMHFRALGYLLRLHELEGITGFTPWARERGVVWDAVNGLHFTPKKEDQHAHMVRLNKELFPERGCRIRIAELGDAFPECQITCELVSVDNPERFNGLFASLLPVIEAARKRRFLTVDERAALTFAWQEAELMMIPTYVEMCHEMLAAGRHVAIFVNFRRTLAELQRILKTPCVIHGGQTGPAGARERQANLEAFQADEAPVLISTSAGSESLDMHDTHGNFPRGGIVSLGWSARIARQTFGRLPRSGSKSKPIYRCPLAAGTVQEGIHANVTAKLTRMDLLNDGDLIPGGSGLELTEIPSDVTEGVNSNA